MDLGDDRGDDIVVESFDDVMTNAQHLLPFQQHLRKRKKGLLVVLKRLFSQDSTILRNLKNRLTNYCDMEPQYQAMSDEELCSQTELL